MTVKLSEAAIKAVEEILRRGNNAVIRRKGEDVVICEEKRKTVYEPSLNRR